MSEMDSPSSVSEMGRAPRVSIVMPTFNRERFLPQAFESIRMQGFHDWELIVVDDGSTDNTREVVSALAAGMDRPVRYIGRENGGPAAARNTGIEHARGEYFAFFDSDDIWLPHHLDACVRALDANPDIQWVFAAGRREHYETGRVIFENSFYVGGVPRRFLALRSRPVGELVIIDDPGLLRCALRGGGFGGLQASVVRRGVFADMRLQSVAFFEDRLAVIRAIASGVRMAYFKCVGVISYAHGNNISFATSKPIEARVAANREFVRALQCLPGELTLSWRERAALRAQLSRLHFWHIGFPLLQHGLIDQAIRMMWRGIAYEPWNMGFWRTYVTALVGGLRNRGQRPASEYGDQPGLGFGERSASPPP